MFLIIESTCLSHICINKDIYIVIMYIIMYISCKINIYGSILISMNSKKLNCIISVMFVQRQCE